MIRRKIYAILLCFCYSFGISLVLICGFPLQQQYCNPHRRQQQRCDDDIVKTLRSSSTPPQTYSKISFQLYGIKGLRAWFDSQFPEAVVSIDASAAAASSTSSTKSRSSSSKNTNKKRSSSSSSSNTKTRDTFDHVLIDMNQILHVTLRRSRGDDGLAVRLVMSELDRVLEIVTPRRSLVLAIDGPPAAAKLATQRRRRFSTLVRTEWKLQHFEKLRLQKRERAKRLRAYQSELESLQITPATKFMENMEATLLYWAWQRLQQRYSKFNKVRFYINPSNVAGEGEVKLLEWVIQQSKHIKGDTIAILGRDSDLLLEGLILPPYYTTHNIFVIRQETSRLYLCVSLWETTRALYRWIPKNAPPNQILQLRTDIVMLLMINGNDYLPKLRGAHGFSRVCSIYRKILAEYYEGEDGDGKDKRSDKNFGLVEPSSLEFNLDFAIKFFQAIADLMPVDLWENNQDSNGGDATRKTPLGELNSIMDGGFVPRPIRFQVVDLATREEGDLDDDQDEDDGDDDMSQEETETDDDSDNDDAVELDEEEEETDRELVRLILGKPGSDDCLRYEYWKDVSEPFKSAKQKLASMALDDFLGTDYAEGSDDFDEETGITTSGYAWEVTHAVEGKVETYLGGLLWNLQTYQDGICADYNYNYGRRQSPSARDIVEFLKQAKKDNRTVGRRDLLGDRFSKPVSGGLSCLAALPSQVKHLVPEPYSSIAADTVERCYASCMDPEDNCFDLKTFEQMIENEMNEDRNSGDEGDRSESSELEDEADGNYSHGRRIILGDHYWTVIGKSMIRLNHPFKPPSPPLESFSELKWNDRIRASRMFALETPVSRAVWGYPTYGQEKRHHPAHRKFMFASDEISHTDLGEMLQGGKKSILDIPYETRFQKRRKTPLKMQKKVARKIEDAAATKKKRDNDSLSHEITLSSDGQTAFACLKQLEDIGLIGKIEYTVTKVSGDRGFGDFHPEETRLLVKRGGKSSILKSALLYDLRRDASTQPRQVFKHHLASLALEDIVGSSKRKWSDMTFPELRGFLKEKSKKAKS